VYLCQGLTLFFFFLKICLFVCLFIYFSSLVLGIELRVLHMLGKSSTEHIQFTDF
jgi:hypothetical protein